MLLLQAGASVSVSASDVAKTMSASVDVKTLFSQTKNTNVFKNTTNTETLVTGMTRVSWLVFVSGFSITNQRCVLLLFYERFLSEWGT